MLLRTRGGYAGASDHRLLTLPYLRFRQDVRLAAEAERIDYRSTSRQHALVAYHVIVANWQHPHRKPPTWEAFLRDLRLDPRADRVRPPARATPEDRAAIARVEHMIRTYSGSMRRQPVH